MGIKGLLSFLKAATIKQHISRFAFNNQTAGVDITIWIYKAIYHHFDQMHGDINAQGFLAYIHNFIDLLQHYQIKIYCVFDGRSLPKKKPTIRKRFIERQNNQRIAQQKSRLSPQDIELMTKYEQIVAQERESHMDYFNNENIDRDIIEIQQREGIDEQQGVFNRQRQSSGQEQIQVQQVKQIQKKEKIQENEDTILKQHQLTEQIKQKEQSIIFKQYSRKQRQSVLKAFEALQKRLQSGKKYFKRSIFANQHIIALTMRALKNRSIPFIVAPYETDSQLAKMHKQQIINFAISQDSDLVIYEIPTVYKLKINGQCDYIDLPNCKLQLDKKTAMLGKFLKMDKYNKAEVAILAGSDYLKSLKGIGPSTAVKYVSQCQRFDDAIRLLRQNSKYLREIPEDYQYRTFHTKLIFLMASCYSLQNNAFQFLDAKCADSIDLKGMAPEQIYQIVGWDYGYSEQIMTGLRAASTLMERNQSPLERSGESIIDVNELAELQSHYQQVREARKIREQQYQPKKQQIQIDLRTFITNKNQQSANSQPHREEERIKKNKKKQQKIKKPQKLIQTGLDNFFKKPNKLIQTGLLKICLSNNQQLAKSQIEDQKHEQKSHEIQEVLPQQKKETKDNTEEIIKQQ